MSEGRLGKYLGYPPCCVEEFEADDWNDITATSKPGGRREDGAPWDGTGFIPCSDCMPAARADFQKFVAERIAPHRVCALPFPEDDIEECGA